jgi:hypothetical protein
VGAPDLGAARCLGGRGDGFFGNQPAVSEALLQQSHHPIRHFYFKLETPVSTSPFGQTWELLGWQAYFVRRA